MLKICPHKTYPLRMGRNCSPPPLSNSFSPAQSPKALWGALLSVVIPSRTSAVYMPLVLCAILLVDTCSHHSVQVADLLPSSSPANTPADRWGPRDWAVVAPLLSQSVLPALSLFCAKTIPSHPTLPCTSQLFSTVQKSLAMPDGNQKPVCGLGPLVTWESQTPGQQRGCSLSFAFQNGISLLSNALN